jgi:hypothetical protein
MLRSISDLENYAIRAVDGTIGHVKDFYFDDETWVIRRSRDSMKSDIWDITAIRTTGVALAFGEAPRLQE